MSNASGCDCLTSEDASLPHFMTCPAAGANPETSDLRELAEIAAYKDIDTALAILRRYMDKGLV
ncbi:hypothetical protein SEA_LARS_23 [Mycobacterium phage Lars]|uniref:Uncharacterized protein n=1 Tax=Mycobacterium phage Lars TaxID=2836022 RepID=A0A8F3E488_9CAUD|nr:hypothetical protein SEA_LARS_23 [Mycobacterium phage Lars]